MALKLVLLGLLCLGWTSIAIIILTVNLLISTFGRKFFAGFCSKFAEDYNGVSHSLKVELFKELNEMKPGEKISILEVGAGPGANFKYYNRPAAIQSVEPNLQFESYFNDNRAKYPNLDIQPIKEGFGEDLGRAGIADNSCDAVVVTLVLCSVTDQLQCIQEIKRVLKPGGKFFYMEHIAAAGGSRLRLMQNFLMLGGFWPFMVDGCCVDRATDLTMASAGFSQLNQRKYDLPIPEEANIIFKLCGNVIKPHVMGVASK